MICILPAFIGISGLAVDGATAYRAQSVLQTASDAAALAAALNLPNVTNAQAAAVSYAMANMPNNGAVLVNTDIQTGRWDPDTKTFVAGGTPINSVHVTTRLAAQNGNPLPTTFLRLVGVDSWDVAAEATATMSQPKVWVTLALDNTGSMSEKDRTGTSKITALKRALYNPYYDAAHPDDSQPPQLLDLLQNASSNPGDVQVAIVPFTRTVKIGTSYASAPWLSFADFVAAPTAPSQNVGPGSTCPWTDSSTGYHCQTTPSNGSSQATTIPSSGTYRGYICPSATSHGHYWNGCFNSVSIGSNHYSHTWIPNSTSTWSGCVTDRDQPYDTLNTTPITGSTRMVAENSPSCVGASIMPLGYDWAAMKTKVDSMSASGSTNQTIGLVWAWQALTQGDPLNPPPLPEKTKRVLILLSDGLNTQNRWSGNGSDQSSAVDARTRIACDQAKADGLEIYTVFVDLSGTSGNSAVLEYCATDAEHYSALTTSGQIISTFEDIGRRITKMRLVF